MMISPISTKASRTLRVRKNMRLDQALLDSAMLALGTDSETEAVTVALRRVVNNTLVVGSLRALGGSGIIDARRVRDLGTTK